MKFKIEVVKSGPYDIYIGRPGPYGNPFHISIASRKAIIAMHKVWLEDHPEIIQQLQAECKTLNKPVIRLKCFCAPLPCHGDNYKEILEND